MLHVVVACYPLLAVGHWSRPPRSAVSARDVRHSPATPRSRPLSAVSARDVRHASATPRARPRSAVSARDVRHVSASPRTRPQSAVSARDVRHASPRMLSHKSPKAKVMSASTSLIISPNAGISTPLSGRFPGSFTITNRHLQSPSKLMKMLLCSVVFS